MKWLLATGAVVMVLGAASLFALERWHRSMLPLDSPVVVELARGEAFSSFARALAAQGLISHPRYWSLRARLTGAARSVQAGEYQLSPGDTPQALLDRLRSGQVLTYQVQLIEGWTLREALGALRAHPQLTPALTGADEQTLLSMLGLPAGHAEGMFFPDTYQFERGATDADILRRAYDKLQDELARVWESRDSGLPYDRPYDALIVASLIEKETGQDSDRSRIAQVFVNRLERGMRLQTDPTVIYGIGPGFNGNLTRRDLRTDTPYNTYTRHGLPPSPIALVGVDSLAAAVHPAPGEYLYFVSRGDGSSKFSLSLEEHEAAVRKYQLK